LIGSTEAALAAGTVDERWVGFMKFQLERARGLYERAQLGVPGLSGFGSQRVARLMGLTYGRILNVIEARGYDVFRSRARVGLAGKLALGVQVLLTPNPPMPSLPATTSERTS
jgi:phytoene synthase